MVELSTPRFSCKGDGRMSVNPVRGKYGNRPGQSGFGNCEKLIADDEPDNKWILADTSLLLNLHNMEV